MLDSIQNIGLVSPRFSKPNVRKQNTNSIQSSSDNFYSLNTAKALKLNSLNLAKTVSFTGALIGAFKELNDVMVTCKTDTSDGESAGKRANVNRLLHGFIDEFSQVDDAIKTSIRVNDHKPEDDPIYARTQIKMIRPSKDIAYTNDLLFQMAVRDHAGDITDRTSNLKQLINIMLTPVNYKGQGTKEQAYVLNTKGNLMAVVEDGDDVILTNAGTLSKKECADGLLDIDATQWVDKKGSKNEKMENIYKPFTAKAQPVRERIPEKSEGEGTEIIIGMEDGRFVDEIKDSILTFVEKVKNGDIVLDKFVANKNAKSTQLVMLAAGYGSRAEYTNASSSAIFHNIDGGTQSTKGVFRTATGLTPMETSFVTLHNAGLLDCSKENLDIDKNIKFYLNQDINRGNGGYTLGLAKKMMRDDAKSIMILPNDSMSRMTNAIIKAKELTDSGNAAIAMIAKKVEAQDCINTFGIMRLNNQNQIMEFKEKPSKIDPEFIVEKTNGKDMCLTNTFQFTVSREALKVMELVEPFYTFDAKNKESRDWSKNYIPVIQAITMYDNPDDIRAFFAKNPKVFGKDAKPLDDATIFKAKEILHGQKLYAVPTDEPWADCGTLNQLYMTTMQIASGDFKLEDFERAHVLSCVDTEKGLVASSEEQKKRILDKYILTGQIMAVPQAKPVNYDKIKDIPVTVNERTV